MKKTQGESLDRISTFPRNIIENILSRMPIRVALRTSILSTKWRYSWRSMPKLLFTHDMVEGPSDSGFGRLEKYKLVNAIFHVLLLHNGPTILAFDCSDGNLQMDSEFDLIFSYLARGNNVKELTIFKDEPFYKLPVSFFSLQGLERIVLQLEDCVFEPPLTFNGFSQLTSMTFLSATFSDHMPQRFLSKCPLLKHIVFWGVEEDIDSAVERSMFTYVDLLQCMPSIEGLGIKKYYMKYLAAGGIPHNFESSLTHLNSVSLDVCLMERNEISSALYLIKCSPVLERLIVVMYDNDKLPVHQTPNNFLDIEHYSNLKLSHLEDLEIRMFKNLPLEIEFVKLIMAKSPVLKEVIIKLNVDVSVEEELKIYRDLLQLSFQHASPSAKLIIKRP